MRGVNETVFGCGLPLRGDMEPVASVIARRMPDANRLRFRLALLGQVKPSALAMPALRTVLVGVGRDGGGGRPGTALKTWVTKLNGYWLLGAAVCGI